MVNIPDRDCVVCRKPFKPMKVNNVICPDIRCKYERHRQQITEWNRDNYPYIEKENFKCSYCSLTVTKKRYDQKTCSSKECVGKHNYQMRKKREKGVYDERYLG